MADNTRSKAKATKEGFDKDGFDSFQAAVLEHMEEQRSRNDRLDAILDCLMKDVRELKVARAKVDEDRVLADSVVVGPFGPSGIGGSMGGGDIMQATGGRGEAFDSIMGIPHPLHPKSLAAVGRQGLQGGDGEVRRPRGLQHEDSSDGSFFKPPKLELPRFDGKDPTDWLFVANHFFDYHKTPDSKRLEMAAFHMTGPALAWFQWMDRSKMFASWPGFQIALEKRFGPSEYDDPQEAIAKLFQRGSVQDYQRDFERLAFRCYGLSDGFLRSCFISGLKEEIKREVKAFKPSSLIDAMSLARLHEGKYMDGSALKRRQPPWPSPRVETRLPGAGREQGLPFKRLSAAEMADRRAKGR